MPLSRSDVESALEAKGFVKNPSADHNYFTYHTTGGKKTSVYTKTSHGSKYKTLGNDLVSAMSKQCKLTSKEFKELVQCSLGREQYESRLVEKKEISLK